MDYKCDLCFDTGWFEWGDRDQDFYYRIRKPCPKCKKNSGKDYRVVNVLPTRPAWKEDQVYKRNTAEVL